MGDLLGIILAGIPWGIGVGAAAKILLGRRFRVWFLIGWFVGFAGFILLILYEAFYRWVKRDGRQGGN